MAISTLEILDAVKDAVNPAQNGDLSFDLFNRLSKRAELSLIDWLSGSVSLLPGMPEPWATQKNKDWLAFLITKKQGQIQAGEFERPDNYYQFENFYRRGAIQSSECDDEENDSQEQCNTVIELLDGDKYNERCNTYIEEESPSLANPISKYIGNKFETTPKDIGHVTLEYIRYPVFGNIKPKMDPVFNEEVADVVVDYEWPEAIFEYLVWFISDKYFNRNSNRSGKEMNMASDPKK